MLLIHTFEKMSDKTMSIGRYDSITRRIWSEFYRIDIINWIIYLNHFFSIFDEKPTKILSQSRRDLRKFIKIEIIKKVHVSGFYKNK